MKGSKLFTTMTAVAVAAMFTASAQAADLALDVASDAAYGDGWTTGDNGGYGFGPWTLSTSGPFAGHLIASSTLNAGGSGGVDTGGKSFGMYANDASQSAAVRPFTGALTIGQSFLIDFDTGLVDTDRLVSVALQNNLNENHIQFWFIGGDSTYGIVHFGGIIDSQVAWTGNGLKLEFKLTGANTMDLVIRKPDGTHLKTHTGLGLSGTLGSGVHRVRVFNDRAGGDPPNYLYFNSLAIIPEPTTYALVAMGLLGVCLLRRRKT